MWIDLRVIAGQCGDCLYCTVINKIERVVEWKSGNDVRLRLVMQDADLYALRVP